ncbi:MAG: hypothetical protein ABSC77_05550 [Terracidiphilus sp.]|jgi:hypothetical protein
MDTNPTYTSTPLPDWPDYVHAAWIGRLLGWFLFAIALWLLCPAHKGIWWHVRNGNWLEWQDMRFKLPLVWSVPPTTVYRPGGIILERESWFPFVSPGFNSLYLNPPVPKQRRDRLFANERQSMAIMPWGPVSEFSRCIGSRHFRCVTQPAPLHVFGVRNISNLHANCEEEGTGWNIAYWGAPTFLDEALAFLGEGEALPPGQAKNSSTPDKP